MSYELLGERRLLRAAILGDSIVDGLLGLACILAAGPVAALLGLEAENATLRLRVLGLILFTSGALLLWTAAQHRINRHLAHTIIALNLVWIAISVGVAFRPWFALTDVGRVILLLQALIFAIFAGCQIFCVRQPIR